MNQRLMTLAEVGEVRQIIESRPPRFVTVSLWLLAALVLAGGIWAFCVRVPIVVKVPGRIRPLHDAEVLVATESSGRVARIICKEGELVRAGQLLIELDRSRHQVERVRIAQTIEAAETEIRRLEKVRELLDEEEAATLGAQRDEEWYVLQLDAARRVLAEAREERERLRGLLDSGAIPRKRLEEADNRVLGAQESTRRAEIEIETAAESRRAIMRSFAARREELSIRTGTRVAELAMARKESESIQRELARCTIRSKVDGVVTRIDAREGQVVSTGGGVVRVAAGGVCMEVLIPSREIGRVSVDMPVRVVLDVAEGAESPSLSSNVEFVSADSEVVDGLSMFRARMRLQEDSARIGMTGTAQIMTGHRRLLALIFKGFLD